MAQEPSAEHVFAARHPVLAFAERLAVICLVAGGINYGLLLVGDVGLFTTRIVRTAGYGIFAASALVVILCRLRARFA